MAYMRFNIRDEAAKVARGRKSKVDAGVLLSLIADEYLRLSESDDLEWMERLYKLDDPRVSV